MAKVGTGRLLVLAIVAVLVGGVWLFRSSSSSDPSPSSAPRQPETTVSTQLEPGTAASGQPATAAPTPPTGSVPTGTPQPPGPAPEGKVWHAGHGHWHDAQPTTPGQANTPPPPGEAPPGKVWNAAHGHYHDAPAGQAAPDSGEAGTP